MVEWLVFGERIVGRVTARHRDEATIEAYRKYGQTHRIHRVQSAASFAVAQDEDRVRFQRRRPPSWPEP